MAGKKKKIKLQKRASLPFAVCVVSVCVLRRGPSDTQEIVSQLLFGETVEVLIKKHNSWMHVRCCHDGYEGWVDSKQLVRISEEENETYEKSSNYSLDVVQSISNEYHTFPILLGSKLPKFDGLHLKIHDYKYLFNGTVIDTQRMEKVTAELVERIARKYIHAPYLWGGRSIFGIDCSGFTQQVFKFLNYKLPRDAYQQVNEGVIIDFLETCKVGDLAFFENEEKKIIHVGIILPNNKIIHASGSVRIDNLDHEGIYNKELKKYTHKFRVAKRVIILHEGE